MNLNKMALCSNCGWSGKYTEAKHLTIAQLLAKKVIDENEHVIDSHILHVKRSNGGWVDLTWCPKCDTFIETYYEKSAE